ncbi:WD repeat-containing protein 13 [Chamberlinius hualienensis]
MSAKSGSRLTLDTGDPLDTSDIRWGTPQSTSTRNSRLVPTYAANASRAIVGGTTIEENYAFAGMHHIFDQHHKAVTRVRFANNDKHQLACCSADGTLSICSLDPPSVVCQLIGHTAEISDFEWSASNDHIVSCSHDGTIRLWDTQTSSCLRVVHDDFKGQFLCCSFQPMNNNMIVASNNKGSVQVVNISTGIYIRNGSYKISGKALCLAFDSSGKILWTGDNKGIITTFHYDIATGKLTKGKRFHTKEEAPITSISYRNWISREARDPSLLINAAANSLLLFGVIDAEGGLQLKRKFNVCHNHLRIHSSFCPIMSFRQGACVVSASEDCCVYFFDVEREFRPCVNKLQGHSAPVLDVCFNYDESLLASSDSKGIVIVWKRE